MLKALNKSTYRSLVAGVARANASGDKLMSQSYTAELPTSGPAPSTLDAKHQRRHSPVRAQASDHDGLGGVAQDIAGFVSEVQVPKWMLPSKRSSGPGDRSTASSPPHTEECCVAGAFIDWPCHRVTAQYASLRSIL